MSPFNHVSRLGTFNKKVAKSNFKHTKGVNVGEEICPVRASNANIHKV